MSGLNSGHKLSNRFRLIRRLGQGGMAEVWLVHDEVLDEPLAAKLLPEGADERLEALLRHECKQARRLVHPNIVPVFDLRRDGDRRYVTMAYVEGPDAGSLRGEPASRIIDAATQIADALVHAHGLGVVHRDLKASNVRIGPGGRPLITDFGIAGLLDESGGPRVRGGGSPGHASPEQRSGSSPAVTDDVFALGALLERLVSETDDVPARLRSLVSRMQDPDPAARPPDMHAVRVELTACREELDRARSTEGPRPDVTLIPPPKVEPIRPIPPPARATTAPGGARRPVALASAAVVLALAAVALALPWVGERLRRAEAEPPVAASPAAGAALEDPPAPDAPESPTEAAAAAKRLAEKSLAQVMALTERLEASGVRNWGGESWASVETLVARADAALRAGDAAGARETYDVAAQRLEALEAGRPELLRQALAEARSALDRGDASGARTAFQAALEIEPGQPAATTGLRRAAVLDEVLASIATGRAAEVDARLADAESAYAAAAALDPLNQAAQEALARVRARIVDERFSAAMSEALAALERREWDAATEAFARAETERPGSPEVSEGLAQAREGRYLERIAGHRARAGELELAERWQEAADEYRAVLELDASVRFAQQGFARASARATLAERLDFHLAHPQRLSSDAVFAEAGDLLDGAREVTPAGPEHRRRVERLAALLERAGTRVSVWLESDDETDVSVYRVGRLGRFVRHELTLRPGTYTVVGTRRGYRDVRYELVVEPGRGSAPLVVRCEEKI